MSEFIKNSQGFRVEIANYSKSGREYWLDIEVRPLHNSQNQLTGFMAIEHDITERKKFEATLVRRDNQLTLAAQIAGLGHWEYDVLADIFTFNDQFYNVFRTSAKAVGGYSMTSARYAELFVHPDDAAIVSQSVIDAIKSVEEDFSFKAEHRIVYSDGEIGFISVHFRSVKDELGRTIKNFGVNQDITEQKTIELERLALIDSLQNKNKDLQQFSYIVSHNLRAPIAKIMGLISVMESESDENKFMLEKLTEEAAQLDDVVKDINTIVSARKSEKEKMDQILFQVKINLIKQVLEDKIIDSKATILTDFSAAPEIWSIRSYIYSILYNLISNSIKYRKPEVPLQIEVKSSQDEKFICLSVKDNGEGIDLAKNGNKLFGLYKRFHTGSVTGKGIGLNLVKTHAESLGGHVDVNSHLNIGTTFRVYIPKHDDKTM
jgi:signal transduction histidine kinase